MMDKLRVVAIVVARESSTRIPGKALMDLCGQPVLWHVMQIAKAIRGITDLCVATTDLPIDDSIAALAEAQGINCYRGDAVNVLDRLHGAAEKMKADVIIDIGGDCPLLDPEIISRALADFHASPCDYLCNYEPPTFPEGMDVNIIRKTALEKAWREALAPSQRIHPFSFLTFHPELFVIRNFSMEPDLSQYHWSLDFPEDVELIRLAYEKLWVMGKLIGLESLQGLLRTDASFSRINAALRRPKVSHAFWNSPGIVHDMHNDLNQLMQMAFENKGKGQYELAAQCYSEVSRIASKLEQAAGMRA
jgi:spore coat polysaccharide biosynthesis protein SpsF (cytidylyltransferase family)